MSRHLGLQHGHEQQGYAADAAQRDNGQAERLRRLESQAGGDNREWQTDQPGRARLPGNAADQEQQHHRAEHEHADGLVGRRHRTLTRTSRITATARIEPNAYRGSTPDWTRASAPEAA